MNSEELEDRLPSLKDAILTIQTSNQGQDRKVDCVPIKSHPRSSRCQQEDQVTSEHDSMLLPHERVGIDFSWLQSSSLELSNDRPTDDLEDEESFLYGDVSVKKTVAHLSKTGRLATNQYVPSKRSPIVSPQLLENLEELLNIEPPQVASHGSSAPVPAVKLEAPWRQEPSSCTPHMNDCEKFQRILQNMGVSLATADVSKLFVKVEEKEPSPAHVTEPASQQTPLAFQALGGNTNAWQALETLQSLIKATKEKRTKGDVATISQRSKVILTLHCHSNLYY